MLLSWWNEGRVNWLKSLWAQGLSITQIALEMAVTRNKVIGKAHRLKLPTRRPKGRRVRGGASGPRRAPSTAFRPSLPPHARPEPIVVPPSKPVEDGVGLLDLEQHHCRAIVGNGPDGLARFCGAPKSGNVMGHKSSYCPEHASRYYNFRT